MSEMWSHPWVAAVLFAAVRGAPLVLIAGVGVLGWRRSSAAARHLVWLVAIAGMLALPMLSASLPAWRVAVLPPEPAPTTEHTAVAQPEPVATSIVRTVSADVPSAPIELTAGSIETEAPRNWGRIAFFLWCIGASLVALPMLIGHARVWTLSRTARRPQGGPWGALASTVPHSLGIAGRVRIMVSDRATMPMAFGIVNPTVLLPADAEHWPLARRRDVMLHELAHVMRRDCLTQLLAQAACALYWFDPLVWLAARALRVERERACDDAVVRAGARPSEYATHLLQVARDLRVPRSASLATVCMARRSQLSERLLAILDERRNRRTVSRGFAVPAWLGAIAIVIPAAAVVPSSPTLGPLPIIVSAIVPSEAVVAERKRKPARAKQPVAKGVAPVFTAADLLGQQTECDYSRKGNTSISHNDDDEKQTLRAHIAAGDCDLTIRMIGKVRFTDDLSDVKSVPAGGSLIVTESDAVTTRRIEIRSDEGRITRKFTVDGVERPWDDEGRRWLATTLVALERRTALMADTRVPALYREGGVDAVFRELALLSGDYARRRYFEVLFKTAPSLSESDTRRALEVAGTMESDYELAETLIAIGKVGRMGGSSAAYLRAVKNIESDYEARRVINALLKTTTPDTEAMELLLEVAGKIESDYELAELLLAVSGRGLSSSEARDSFFKAVSTIESDYERRRVLMSILKRSENAEDVQKALLQSASTIDSDFELAEFLVAFARTYPDMSASTHEVFMKTADSVGSEHEYGRVMQSVRGRARRTSGMF